MDFFILFFKALMTSVILFSFLSDPDSIEISFHIGLFTDSFSEIGGYYSREIIPLVVEKCPSFAGAYYDSCSLNLESGFPVYKYVTDDQCSICIEPDCNGWLDIKLMNRNGFIVSDYLMEKKEGIYIFVE
jgi:hypothetical protein